MYQTINQYSKGQRGINIKYNLSKAKHCTLEGDDYWMIL
jgi:hypothetical protein